MITEIINIALQNWGLVISVLILYFIAYLLNEFMEASLKNEWTKGNLKFLNSGLSSNNKWKLDENGNVMQYIKVWYYPKFYQPKHAEKFILSSTWLVPLTDGEHMFQLLVKIIHSFVPFIIGFWFGGIMVGVVLFLTALLGGLIGGAIKELLIHQIR